MTPRQLTVQLALAVGVLVALNAGVTRLANNSVPRQLLGRAERAEPATDVFLGNSTMAAGLDEHAFAAARGGTAQPLNLGCGATKPVEHDLIYRQQERHRAAAIHYGFLDTQLTDPPDGGWAALTGKRAVCYYVEPQTAAKLYFPEDAARQTTFWVATQAPVFVERGAIWARVERVRRELGEIGMSKRAEDFALLETEPEAFARRCAAITATRAPLAPAVVALLEIARERGVIVDVIEMPVTEQHRHRFYHTSEWAAYRAHIAALVREAGARFVPAADWVGDDGFADHLHLNAAGARAFSERFASETGRQP